MKFIDKYSTSDLYCNTVLHTRTGALNKQTDTHTYVDKDIDGSNALQAKQKSGF